MLSVCTQSLPYTWQWVGNGVQLSGETSVLTVRFPRVCITSQNELHLIHPTDMTAGRLKDVKAIFGFHVWPASPSGSILTKAGTALYPFCSSHPYF